MLTAAEVETIANLRAMETGQKRILLDIFDGEDGFILLLGLILVGLTALACFYCHVYDPLKQWCIKTYIWLKGGPKDKRPQPPERTPPPEVR